MGKSAIGAGRKVGIYNYVTQFMDFKEKSQPKVEKQYYHELFQVIEELEEYPTLKATLNSYMKALEEEFLVERDYFGIRGEDNHFRYLPLKNVVIRVSPSDTVFETVSRIMAARVSNVHFTVSINDNARVETLLAKNPKLLSNNDRVVVEDDDKFGRTLKNFERVLYSNVKKVPPHIFDKAAETLTFIVRQQPMMEGRLELLNYFIEQSISHSYHRYGNIGARELNKK